MRPVTAAVVRLLNLKHHHRDASGPSAGLPDPGPPLLFVFSGPVKTRSKDHEALHQTAAARPPPRCVVTRKLGLVATRDAATRPARKTSSLKRPLASGGAALGGNNAHKHAQMVFHF